MRILTLEEAIHYAEDLGTEEENKIDYDKDSPHTIIRKKNTVKDYRQLAEWLRELKEAKRLLKAAVEDFRILGTMLEDGHGHCTAEISCDECMLGGGNLADDCQWRHEAEVLKLIEEEEE